MFTRKSWQGIALIALLVVATGCAAQRAYRNAERDSRRENWDQAVLGYSKALALDPGNTRYSVALERAKLKSSAQHFDKGKRYASAGQYELAIAEYQQTLLLNPGNQHARNELQKAMRELRRQEAGPSDIELLKERARLEAMGPPRLDPRSNIPILLQFKDAEVSKIFDAISKASQINFIYDEKVDLEQKIDIDIGNVTLEKAMDILMLQTKNFYKVIDEATILVAPDTRPKRQEYDDQVIRTFFLSNGDTKQVVTLLRSLLQSRQIAENEDLNSVTIKDTPDKVAIAERIIEANDKSKGEVLIDVELLEINRLLTQNLGIDLSSKTLTLGFVGGDEGNVRLNNLSSLNQQGNWTVGVVPSVVMNFLKSDSETKSIAKPQLRVTEGEKAEILIGERRPIPTTSFNTSQTVGGNIVPITSFTYQNVGITVQIEPRVHHNKEVTLKVQIEISQVSGDVEGQGGQRQPIIGTRQIQTVIRLRDGETNVLAGLIKRDDSDSRSGIPGLVDVPGLNRVLANNSTNSSETDIILTLTPQIIRMPDIREEDLATLWVGTEEQMELRGPTKGIFGVTAFGNGAGVGDAVAEAFEAGRAVASEDETPDENDALAGDEGDREDEADRDAPAEPDDAEADDDRRRTRSVDEDEDDRAAADDEDPFEEDDGPTTPALVRMVPGQTQYRVGDVIEIQVVIDNGENVGSVPFHVRYDRSVVEWLPPAVKGDFLGRDGTQDVFLANDTSGGEIVVGHSRMGSARGADGAGILATLRFQAINPGNAGFQFSNFGVKDPQARSLPASFIPTAVAVVE